MITLSNGFIETGSPLKKTLLSFLETNRVLVNNVYSPKLQQNVTIDLLDQKNEINEGVIYFDNNYNNISILYKVPAGIYKLNDTDKNEESTHETPIPTLYLSIQGCANHTNDGVRINIDRICVASACTQVLPLSNIYAIEDEDDIYWWSDIIESNSTSNSLNNLAFVKICHGYAFDFQPAPNLQSALDAIVTSVHNFLFLSNNNDLSPLSIDSDSDLGCLCGCGNDYAYRDTLIQIVDDHTTFTEEFGITNSDDRPELYRAIWSSLNKTYHEFNLRFPNKTIDAFYDDLAHGNHDIRDCFIENVDQYMHERY